MIELTSKYNKYLLVISFCDYLVTLLCYNIGGKRGTMNG